MKNFSPIRPSTTFAILALGSALLLSRPFAAAEPPSKSSAAAAPAARDGSLFTAFAPVLRHPRCMNCHSTGDFPRQGDDGHPHAMNVRRGPAGHGMTAEKCSTCHQDHNRWLAHIFLPARPTGACLPPDMPMIWQGLTDGQICQSIKDPKRNRNRNLEQLVEHLTEDKLVMWAWNPGEGRTAVPMSPR